MITLLHGAGLSLELSWQLGSALWGQGGITHPSTPQGCAPWEQLWLQLGLSWHQPWG